MSPKWYVADEEKHVFVPVTGHIERMIRDTTGEGSASGITNIERMLRAQEGVQMQHTDFDQDRGGLNTPVGRIDLYTGELDLNWAVYGPTKITRVAPDKTLPTPTFDKFLNEIAFGDQDTKNFLQRHAGMVLHGNVRDDIGTIFEGEGGGGKSTWAEVVIGHPLGDYFAKLSSDVLTKKEFEPESLTPLVGARAVVLDEYPQGARLNETTFKIIASAMVIPYRRRYADQAEMIPTHSLLITVNHLPATTSDTGVARRVRRVPFNFKPKTKDESLKQKLHAEAAGILAWMIEGAIMYGAQGLGSCPVVDEATEAFREQSDLTRLFLKDFLAADSGARMLQGDFMALWEEFQQAGGRQGRWRTKNILDDLGRHVPGVTQLRSNGKYWIVGVRSASQAPLQEF